MLRLIIIAMTATVLVAACSGISRAEIIYVEDFEGEQGEPAFDPMFNHEFEGLGGHSGYWSLSNTTCAAPEHDTVLVLAPAQDTVSFRLEPGQEVIFASVEVQSWGGSATTPYDDYSIDFIGRDGWCRVFQLWTAGEWETVEVSSQEIGPIQQIQMRSGEGFFDNITIHVIPEPACIVTAIIGFFVCLTGMMIKTKHV